MASLTVRQLDDKLKQLLRLRAARHGRSMEDEVRVILRQAAAETAREALSLQSVQSAGEFAGTTAGPQARLGK